MKLAFRKNIGSFDLVRTEKKETKENKREGVKTKF